MCYTGNNETDLIYRAKGNKRNYTDEYSKLYNGEAIIRQPRL